MIFKTGGVENRGFGGGRGERSYQEVGLDEIYRLGWSDGGVRGVNRG